MKSFSWDKYFETGLPVIDRQHLHLVDLINRFGGLLSENQIIFDDVEALFGELASYAQYHFDEEESLMRQFAVDSRHCKHHIEEHQSFLTDVTIMHSSVTRENPSSTEQLLVFLIHWLAYHILGTDQNMGRQIIEIGSGVEPAMAYDAQEKESDQSTKPLVIALSGLFKLVSQRNADLYELNCSLEEKVEKRTKELHLANDRLEELSLTDALTGLPNRRHALRCLATQWDESILNDLPLVCMMVDADHFKKVNDTYGHDVGDIVLIELAKKLQHSLRNDDVISRLGGDEFFIICPKTDAKGGMQIAEQTRKSVMELQVPTGDQFWHGSVSIGLSCKTHDMKTYNEMIRIADKGVYLSKKDGKNCVRRAELVSQG